MVAPEGQQFGKCSVIPWAQKGRGRELSQVPRLYAEAFWREGDTELEAGDAFLSLCPGFLIPEVRDQEGG